MMKRQAPGRIISIISDASRYGDLGMEIYSGAKAGAAGFMRSVARTMGRHQITANNIVISLTNTPATQAWLEDPERMKGTMSKYIVRRPASRPILPIWRFIWLPMPVNGFQGRPIRSMAASPSPFRINDERQTLWHAESLSDGKFSYTPPASACVGPIDYQFFMGGVAMATMLKRWNAISTGRFIGRPHIPQSRPFG